MAADEDTTKECPDCEGSGAVDGVKCERCDGFGYFEEVEDDDKSK